ncbi:MAG: TIGR03986 family CRISPR-associated RAMP protein [Candidatus Obscuribacterales bacterium]|nr:TIGR03986 family CRISPR-associated RAMP protein [Candidatus Obscuribacterales bacterium]
MTDQKTKDLPRQSTTIPKDRMASAPYNFVPLPEQMVKVARTSSDLPGHDSCRSDLLTGYFDVKLHTLTPLYIRAGRSLNDPSSNEDPNPDFFHTVSVDKPAIPGSSLRGMLRNIVRMASSGKIEGVSQKKLFFRAMDRSTLKTYYSRRMLKPGSTMLNPKYNVQTGFLVYEQGEYKIYSCEMLRVTIEQIQQDLNDRKRIESGGWVPLQNTEVWLSRDGERIRQIKKTGPQNGFEKGILVISGNIPRKKSEFVFLAPSPKNMANAQIVPEDVIRHFQDRDQITQWQQKSFPADKPKAGARDQDGWLLKKSGLKGLQQPIFYLVEKGQVVFLGRAHMFRLPYELSAKDFIPEGLAESSNIDYADALFGYVRQEKGSEGEARAGRVSVGDAVLCGGQSGDIWLNGSEPLSPKILSEPKPTCVQHYLVQDSIALESLKHYGSNCPNETVIRGFKKYWHHVSLSPSEWKRSISAIPDQIRQAESQYTKIRPLNPGLWFSFRIHFNNLTEEELGALCWALHPLGPEGHNFRHRLGMGKPLGLGSIELNAELRLSDQQKRYSELFSLDKWQCGVNEKALQLSDREQLKRLTQKFEAHVLRESGEEKRSHLYQLNRIKCLLKMMDWPGYRPVEEGPESGMYLPSQKRPNTRYMKISPHNEFKLRPLLPDPLEAFGRLSGADDDRENKETRSSTGMELAFAGGKGSNPAPQVQSTIKTENVTLIEAPNKKRIAKIRTEKGEEIRCIKCGNAWGKAIGHIFQAKVTRDAENKAIEAEFQNWTPKS